MGGSLSHVGLGQTALPARRSLLVFVLNLVFKHMPPRANGVAVGNIDGAFLKIDSVALPRQQGPL